jgi:hypothetical protein
MITGKIHNFYMTRPSDAFVITKHKEPSYGGSKLF